MPSTALVGLITYGTQVHVHELGFAECPKMYIFRGTKEVGKQQLVDQLGLGLAPAGVQRTGGVQGVSGVPKDGVSQENISRFLLPVSECEFALTSVRN